MIDSYARINDDYEEREEAQRLAIEKARLNEEMLMVREGQIIRLFFYANNFAAMMRDSTDMDLSKNPDVACFIKKERPDMTNRINCFQSTILARKEIQK